mmetsp:Transcript_19393/g.39251  ORF Transcript_19393/g.39251 Transcript_19393/m.39251 type:complete len:96 (+) Transcript_19393:794-1081(+)
MHRLNPVIPLADDQDNDPEQLFDPLTYKVFFNCAKRRNFKDTKDEKQGEHFKLHGDCSESHDPRVMIIHDYPLGAWSTLLVTSSKPPKRACGGQR